MLERFIEQLSKDLGWEEPILKNEAGSYDLHFEPNLRITLKQMSDTNISFFSKLGGMPKERNEEFIYKLMKANLLGKETGGAILGLDRDGKEVVLLSFLLNANHYKPFKEALEDFTNYAEIWKDETMKFLDQKKEESRK